MPANNKPSCQECALSHEPECHIENKKNNITSRRRENRKHPWQNTLCRTRILQKLHKHIPVLAYTTKLAQTRSSTTVYYNTRTRRNTFQYYGILQNLHKVVPSTTVYYKACTNTFPVLPYTTKLAQSRSQYYRVLQSLQKIVPSTTVYYKACTNMFPVLLCTTKLAQTRSQY